GDGAVQQPLEVVIDCREAALGADTALSYAAGDQRIAKTLALTGVEQPLGGMGKLGFRAGVGACTHDNVGGTAAQGDGHDVLKDLARGHDGWQAGACEATSQS